MKRTFKVNELVDAECELISVVQSGANGLPFRRLKEESETMSLDFDRFFRNRKAKAAPEGPEILALIVSDKAPEAIVEKLKSEGFDLSEEGSSKGKGSTVFPQVEFDIDDEDEPRIAYKAHDDVVVLQRVEKQFQPFAGSTSFKENLASEGFFPKAQIATDVFSGTLLEIMFSADDKGEASRKLKKEGTSFVNTLADLVSSLPARTFKLEAALDEVVKEMKSKAETAETEPAEKPEATEEEPKTETVKAEATETESTEKGDEEKAGFTDPVEGEDDEKTTKKAAPTAPAVDAKSIADAVLAAIAPRLDALDEAQGKLTRRQKAVDEALTGSANVSDLGDEETDGGEPEEVHIPLHDSAMEKYRDPTRRII